MPACWCNGGGKAISNLMTRLEIQPEYKDGQRITTSETLEVAEMVLSGLVNKQLVLKMGQAGLDAIGLSGIDRQLLTVEAWGENMGLVGRIINVRTEVLSSLLEQSIIPVISPISMGPASKYNVNADHAAGKIAGALEAEKAVFISNVPGVIRQGKTAASLTDQEIHALIHDGIIQGGMIPKVNAALDALSYGAQNAVITNLDGFTQNSGTIIYQPSTISQQKVTGAQPAAGGIR